MARVAYFTMEIGLVSGLPTYSGGLGMLAGDSIRSAADLKLPLIGVTLLHRKGYFHQRIEADGSQAEEPVGWVPTDYLQETPARAKVRIEGRDVHLRAWKRDVLGVTGGVVPVYFLDADLPENDPGDRDLTSWLYGGDQRYRMCQEVILGIGGVRMLRALGYHDLDRYHLNEGHAALLVLELVRENLEARCVERMDAVAIDAVRRKCVFTTHTPVAAGHDRFPLDMVRSVLGDTEQLERAGLFVVDGSLHMTHTALNFSRYVNGVAKRHGQVSRAMFPKYTIDSITNGVHAAHWASPSVADLFDRHIPEWRADNASLRHAVRVPSSEVWDAHQRAKARLLERVNHQTNAGFEASVFTIGFARRFTPYKRPGLLLSDLDRLRAIAQTHPIQIVYAGKAHPRDGGGKDLVRQINQTVGRLRPEVRMTYLPNYDMETGRLIVAGCDVWLNTPEPPLEASGTSGMKAAMNGVPSLSILDGWWIEGCIEDVTGWAIGSLPPVRPGEHNGHEDAPALYEKLADKVLPTYYHDRAKYIDVMRHAMAINGSYFNTQRMMLQYVSDAYFP